MWIEDEEHIGHEFVQYFAGLFTFSDPQIEGELIDAIQPKESDRMNASLIREFLAMEVKKALKQKHPTTAPGPDGMPPLFYQHFWPTVKETVICNTLNFLNHSMAPPKFHETHIVLIPKTKDPARVTDYRPISLCNVAYKLASKVVANRMKVVL